MTTRKNVAPHNIPVSFPDDEPSAGERASVYDLAGDAEGADEDVYHVDASDLLDPNELIELFNAQEATPSGIGGQPPAGADHGATAETVTEDTTSGPVVAELVATRAELRRVETELQRVSGDLQKAEQDRSTLADAHARLQADFDNFRKRGERTRAETHQSIVSEVVSHLLPIADNLRRALETSVGAGTGYEQFALGVELIRKQLDDVLATYGVEPVAAVGELFDPHVHEAIAVEETDEFPPNTIVSEVVRGYRLGDRLLRPALVKVAAAS